MTTPTADMSTGDATKPPADLRDLLAEEGTFLAWIRTGLTLMGRAGDVPGAGRRSGGPRRQSGMTWRRAFHTGFGYKEQWLSLRTVKSRFGRKPSIRT